MTGFVIQGHIFLCRIMMGNLLMLFMIAVLIQVSKYVELFNYSGLLPAIKLISVWLPIIILSGVIPDCLCHQLLINKLFPPLYEHEHLWKIFVYAVVIWSLFLNLCVLFPQLFLVLTLCAVFWVSFLHNSLLHNIADIWLTVHLRKCTLFIFYFSLLPCSGAKRVWRSSSAFCNFWLWHGKW